MPKQGKGREGKGAIAAFRKVFEPLNNWSVLGYHGYTREVTFWETLLSFSSDESHPTHAGDATEMLQLVRKAIVISIHGSA